MKIDTIGVLSPGDMGHAVGRALRESGREVVTDLSGRSTHTRERAERAGLEDAGSLVQLVARADLVLCILPPAAAEECARAVAAAMGTTGSAPLYADCNAVSPDTARLLESVIRAAGASFVDVGIVGPPPGRGTAPRFYASGAEAERLTDLAPGAIDVRPIGPDVGRASALKMTYAALTKGTMTLHAAVLLAAWQLGLHEELSAELQASQSQAWSRMGIIPFLPADAGRWIGEMEEIAATFREAGVPDDFHRGAAEIFRLLDATPYASETRETLDRSRSLEQTLATLAEQLKR